ncbi:MAG: hypothetical protein GY816_02320, partial [Cytophagales bacterium]|nr:hypothetical protein [Cytophagales bacterium]
MNKNWKSHLIELFIVIVGVSIAFWLSQISQESRDEVVRKNYLSDIQSDLRNDIRMLDFAIDFNVKKVRGIDSVAGLFVKADDHRDVIIDQITQLGNYTFFQPENFTYQSMIASGDFKLLNDG